MAAILHKVKRGENIMMLCLAYGLTYGKLVHLNTKFLGLQADDNIVLHQGDYIVVGDSADPLDLVRILGRKP